VNEDVKFNVSLPNDNSYYANIPEYNGAYTLYAVIVGQRNLLSVVASADFSTGDTGDWAEDWLAPLNVRAVTETTAVMDFGSSESGTLYYAVIPRTRGVPTQQNIFDGQGWNADPADDSGSTAVVRDVAGAAALKGLKPGTDYTVYAFVLKEGNPAGSYPNWREGATPGVGGMQNISVDLTSALGPGFLSKVGAFAFRTQGQSKPVLASVTGRFDTAGDLEIDIAASGAVTVYYHVVPESRAGTTPTPDQVKAFGTAAANLATQRSGSAVAPAVTSDGGTLGPIANILPAGDTYRVYAVVEGVAGGGADSPAELSSVVFSNLFEKPQAVAPMLADIRIDALGWTALGNNPPVFGAAATDVGAIFAPATHDYPGANNAGVKVPNSYKQIRVTPQLQADAPATASVRVNGVTLPATGYIDLTMPAVAGTLFTVKVDVSVPNMQTRGYTVLLKENVPAVTQLYVADTLTPNPLPDGNGNYEVRLQPGEGQRDVAVRIDLDSEMQGAELIVNGVVVGTVLPPNALNGWQFAIPLNANSPTDVTIKVVGPGPNPETGTYTLRIHY
jgi:hypothetical protein